MSVKEEQNPTEEQNKGFKQVAILSSREEYLGIPTKLFVSILIFSVGIGLAMRSLIVAIIFLLLLGCPAYQCHKKDPHAYFVWRRAAIRKHTRWCAGRSRNRKLYILQRRGF